MVVVLLDTVDFMIIRTKSLGNKRRWAKCLCRDYNNEHLQEHAESCNKCFMLNYNIIDASEYVHLRSVHSFIGVSAMLFKNITNKLWLKGYFFFAWGI